MSLLRRRSRFSALLATIVAGTSACALSHRGLSFDASSPGDSAMVELIAADGPRTDVLFGDAPPSADVPHGSDVVAPADVPRDNPPIDMTDTGLTCIAPEVLCPGGTCRDLQTAHAHCGACGHACAGNEACIAGTCECNAGLDRCGTACTDLGADPSNCGACGTRCGGHASCMSGTCTCDTGWDMCGTACVNLRTDPANCGACTLRCASTASCSAGTCGCATGSPCNGGCANFSGDPNNCGSCGNACATHESCASGSCVCVGLTLRVCSGVCVDIAWDHDNCGACGRPCGPRQTCSATYCWP